jgi:hypothetical protein
MKTSVPSTLRSTDSSTEVWGHAYYSVSFNQYIEIHTFSRLFNRAPLKSAWRAFVKLTACSYVRSHLGDLKTTSQQLLRTVTMRSRSFKIASSPILKRSSTASVLGPMLSRGAKTLCSSMTFFLSNKKASAFRRYLIFGLPTEPEEAKAVACFTAADFGGMGDLDKAAMMKSH